VSVIVLQVNSPKYFVIGNVARTGTYPLRTETSLLQALSLAGGFTQFASPKNIKLIRNTGGKQDLRKVNYNKMIDEGGEGNFLLKSGDTIVVP
jgi:polysaccharide export outer membrane protein